jgi:hypothetical protein
MGDSTCPSGSVSTFPLPMLITATEFLYDSVSEPITVNFQWAPRSTPPKFKLNSVTDETDGGTTLSQLRFLNNSYTVSSVQIIKASHTAWLIPNTVQATNTEDIAIIFENENLSTPYITFILPILRTNSKIMIDYLKGLSNPNASGSFSLGSCFPKNKSARFAYYSTCLKGSGMNTPSQNMFVFVAVNGISVNDTLMNNVLKASGKDKFAENITAPYLTRITPGGKQIMSNSDFTRFIMSTTDLMNYAQFDKLYPALDNNTSIRTDDVSAYKCVQVDPDAIVDGQIHVDVSTGEPLDNVLSERDNVRNALSKNHSTGPNRFEGFFHTGIGILLAIILVLILLFFVSYGILQSSGALTSAATGASGASGAMPATTSWQYAKQLLSSSSSYINYLIMIVIIGFSGFILGVMVN